MDKEEQLLNEIADIIESTGIEDNNHMWHRDSSLHYAKKILECISKHLPEKRKILEVPRPIEGIDQLWLEGRAQGELSGYSLAIDEVNKLLTTNKKGKV